MNKQGGGRVRLDEAQRQVVESHLWLADAITRELSWLTPMTLDGDLAQPARLGLSKAALHLDPARAAAFVGYARKWIVGEIFRAVDRHHPGFTESHRAALAAYDEAQEVSGWQEDEGPVDGTGDPLAHAALTMGLCAASVRWARGGTGELARILDDELSAYPAAERVLFVGHFLDRETWEDLARDAGISESTAKRRVASMRERIVARLRRRGFHRASG